MKTKLHLLIALAVTLTASPAFAQKGGGGGAPQLEKKSHSDFTLPGTPSPVRLTAFLGVATSPVPPVLAAQLGLPEGFGLVVDEVLPDSPAVLAGVQQFDVLRLFNDQQLTEPSQLAALVRAAGKDASVALTLLRKGQEQKLSLKLTERSMPETTLFRPGSSGGMMGGGGPVAFGPAGGGSFGEGGGGGAFSGFASPPKFLTFQPGGAAQVQVLEPNGTVTYNTANAKWLMKDDTGEVEVSSSNGQRQLIAKNAKGEIVFNGPIDTPEQLKALPEDVRKKIEVMEVRTKLDPPQLPVLPLPTPNVPVLPPGAPGARR